MWILGWSLIFRYHWILVRSPFWSKDWYSKEKPCLSGLLTASPLVKSDRVALSVFGVMTWWHLQWPKSFFLQRAVCIGLWLGFRSNKSEVTWPEPWESWFRKDQFQWVKEKDKSIYNLLGACLIQSTVLGVLLLWKGIQLTLQTVIIKCFFWGGALSFCMEINVSWLVILYTTSLYTFIFWSHFSYLIFRWLFFIYWSSYSEALGEGRGVQPTT